MSGEEPGNNTLGINVFTPTEGTLTILQGRPTTCETFSSSTLADVFLMDEHCVAEQTWRVKGERAVLLLQLQQEVSF